MAESAYSPVPEVSPDTHAPDSTQRIHADASMFGGQIAQATEKLGAGATKAGLFFGQVAADDASNQFQDKANKLLHGDPNAMVTGPDGQSQPDTGFMGLKGRAALDARPKVEEQLNQLLKDTRSGLTTGEQQFQFDQFSRRYRTTVSGTIGAHADAQANSWYGEVNKSTANIALTHISQNAENPQEVAAGAADLTTAYVKDAQLKGGGDELIQDAKDRARRDALKAQLETISVKDPQRAADILDKNKNIAGPLYEPLAAHFRTRAVDQAARTSAQGAFDGANSGAAQPGAAVHAAMPLVRHEEGFQTEPYWDVNHWRIGYGSDTITKSDGTVLSVAPGMHVTKDDAERDLQRRVGLTQTQVQQTIGADKWAALSPAAQASITSVAYNYGHLPNSVATAAISGDPNQIAQSIAGLSGHNNGVNANRRMREANNVLGTFSLSGPAATSGPAQTYQMPGQAPQQRGEPLPIVPASFTPGMPPTEQNLPQAASPNPQAQPAGVMPMQSPESLKADAYQRIKDEHLDPQVEERAFAHLNQLFAQQQILAETTARAKKEANDTAANEYVTALGTGRSDDLNTVRSKIYNDSRLTWETKHTLDGIAMKKLGGTDLDSYGPGYYKALQSVTAPAGRPGRINDAGEILRRALPGGDLSTAGAEKIVSIMHQNARDENGEAVNRAKLGLITYAKSKLSFEQDTGPIKIRDPDGEAIFNAQFLPMFEAAYDQHVKGGGKALGPQGFLNQKNVDELLKGLRNPADMAAARLRAMGDSPADKEAPNAPLPAAPAGVDGKGWNSIVAKPPAAVNGAPFPRATWSSALSMLTTNPTPQNIKMFDESKFGRAGYSAAQIIQQLMPNSPDAALARNAQWAKPASAEGYQTPLTAPEQAEFQTWLKDNNVPYEPSPKADYDMPGFWKSLKAGDGHAGTGMNSNDGQMHFTDYFKTPYHQSFSNESKYAAKDAPHWNEKDQLIDKHGKVVFDERVRRQSASAPAPVPTVEEMAGRD